VGDRNVVRLMRSTLPAQLPTPGRAETWPPAPNCRACPPGVLVVARVRCWCGEASAPVSLVFFFLPDGLLVSPARPEMLLGDREGGSRT